MRHFEVDAHELPRSAINIIRKRMPDSTMSQLRRLFRKGRFQLGEQVLQANTELHRACVIVLDDSPIKQTTLTANRKIRLNIVYQDEHLIVVDKPAGLVVLPGPGHANDTLINGLLSNFPELLENFGQPQSWGLVHRLDRDTSGLIIVARTVEAYEKLVQAFKDRAIEKLYRALLHGVIEADSGALKEPIGTKKIYGRRRQIVTKKGLSAHTEFKVVERWHEFSEVEARLITGRTHQIRVHMAHHGHPVYGDRVYGPQQTCAKRQLLHASELRFQHPITAEEIHVTSKVPADYRRMTRRFSKWQEQAET